VYALYVQLDSPLFAMCLLCVDGKTDTGGYTYWFLPCLLRVNEAGVCLDLPQTRGGF
jgi:hypothetical protein